MASASRRGRTAPKGPKMKMVGKFSQERYHYCYEHDQKMKAILDWDSKAIQYECKEGCKLGKRETLLK